MLEIILNGLEKNYSRFGVIELSVLGVIVCLIIFLALGPRILPFIIGVIIVAVLCGMFSVGGGLIKMLVVPILAVSILLKLKG